MARPTTTLEEVLGLESTELREDHATGRFAVTEVHRGATCVHRGRRVTVAVRPA
jgi:hypothetical protein